MTAYASQSPSGNDEHGMIDTDAIAKSVLPEACVFIEAITGGDMGYASVALKDKIMEMYPAVNEHNISVSLMFDETKDAYIVGLRKGKNELTTHLERKEADSCMNNVKCVYFGARVGKFIRNFESRPE
jgi:hypothetical protein